MARKPKVLPPLDWLAPRLRLTRTLSLACFFGLMALLVANNLWFANLHGARVEVILAVELVPLAMAPRVAAMVASVVEAARAYYDTGEPVTFNYRLQNQGRDSIDLEVSMVMDTWPDGTERGTFLLITDIMGYTDVFPFTKRHR